MKIINKNDIKTNTNKINKKTKQARISLAKLLVKMLVQLSSHLNFRLGKLRIKQGQILGA